MDNIYYSTVHFNPTQSTMKKERVRSIVKLLCLLGFWARWLWAAAGKRTERISDWLAAVWGLRNDLVLMPLLFFLGFSVLHWTAAPLLSSCKNYLT
jgi:hypothetical protein